MKTASRFEMIEIDKLIPYANNSRTHNKEQINKIRSSLREFGFINPVIIDNKYNIIAGHGRIIAAKEENITHVPCVYVEHLSEVQKKAYIIADNRISLDAGWDEELLTVEMGFLDEQGFDVGITGFEQSELADLFIDEDTPSVEEDNFECELPEEPKAKYGDIYQLGNHRLMCGDSTKHEDVEKLLSGKKCNLLFTDPPYNIGYQGVNDKRKIKNDKMSDNDFLDFLTKSLMPCDTAYVCCSWQYSHLFKQAMSNIGMPPKAMIIWNKINSAQHLDKYYKQHEIIFYYGKFGGEKTIRGDIWDVKRQQNTVHPTMKPIELIKMALQDNPDKKIVYDGFGGSGSTLIACEQLNRNCYMMEFDPHYVDVIIERWENLTGEKAVKITS